MLIGLHVTWDEIRQLIINPHSGQPISKATLMKHFRRELAAGGAMLKELAASKYFEALRAGEAWAVRMAMRNRFGWVTEGSTPIPIEMRHPNDAGEMMQITFVCRAGGMSRRPSTSRRRPTNASPPISAARRWSRHGPGSRRRSASSRSRRRALAG